MLLSKLYSAAFPQVKKLPQRLSYQLGQQSVRNGSAKRVLRIYTSKQAEGRLWAWARFYIMLGAVPAALVIFYTSVVLPRAELYEYDPEVYEPEYWEFYSHPLSRFLAKYCMEDPKVGYYKDIYTLEVDARQARARTIIREVDNLQRMRGRRPLDMPMDRISHKGTIEHLDEYAKEHGIDETREN